MAQIPLEKFQNMVQNMQSAYETLWMENLQLRQQVSSLTAALENTSVGSSSLVSSKNQAPTTSSVQPTFLAPLATVSADISAVASNAGSSQSQLNVEDTYVNTPISAAPVYQQPTTTVSAGQKRSGPTTSASNLFNKTTSRLVSSLRPSSLSARLIRSYSGHRDGVWDVTAVYRAGSLIIASASADYAVRLFSVESAQPILAYSGHRGSANSVRFYPSPSRDLILSAAGDSTVHLWEFMSTSILNDVKASSACPIGGTASSDDFDASDDDQSTTAVPASGGPFDVNIDPSLAPSSVVRIPRQSYVGHQGAVVAADFVLGGQQVVSAGWDRIALVFATETGQQLATLSGHDAELTAVSGHPSPGRPMILTASKDASFRMWDLRDRSPQLTAVVQGHTGAVNAAVFAPGDHIVSGGDDRAVRVWDIRSFSSPIAVGKPGSAVNRLAVHWNAGIIGAPLDNSHVYMYDASTCNKLGRLPRRSGGHRRIVSALCWVEQQQQLQQSGPNATPSPNLFTAGFDHRLLGWNVSITGSGKSSAV